MNSILSLLVVLAAVGFNSVEASCHSSSCPTFWVPFQGSCYRAFGTKLTWENAREACHEYFNEFDVAHLVSIRNEAENHFVYKLWESQTGNMVAAYDVTFWIGLTDQDQEGTFVWTDNDETVSYSRWKSLQPDNFNNEDCVHSTNVDIHSPTWNDWGCNEEAYYVCEMSQYK